MTSESVPDNGHAEFSAGSFETTLATGDGAMHALPDPIPSRIEPEYPIERRISATIRAAMTEEERLIRAEQAEAEANGVYVPPDQYRLLQRVRARLLDGDGASPAEPGRD